MSDSDLDMCDDQSTQANSDIVTFSDKYIELETIGYGASCVVKKCHKVSTMSLSDEISHKCQVPTIYAVKIVSS